MNQQYFCADQQAVRMGKTRQCTPEKNNKPAWESKNESSKYCDLLANFP